MKASLPMPTRFLLVCLVLALVLLSNGCRAKGRRPVVPIRGELFARSEGKTVPAAGAIVTFYLQNDPEPLPLHPSATVEKDGSFRPSTYDKNDGLPEGDYKVTVTWQRTRITMGVEKPYGPDRLKNKYKDSGTTPLRVTIKKGTEKEPLVRLDVE